MSLNTHYTVPRAQHFTTNGGVLKYGRLRFYEAGTNTPKATYTTYDASISTLNPYPLDSSGQVASGSLWLGVGRYKVCVDRWLYADDPTPPIYNVNDDSQFAQVDEINGIEGSQDISTDAYALMVVDTIANLKALLAGAFASVIVLGYHAIGDGGGGVFSWDASSGAPDDGGIFISPNSAPAFGRWFRITDGRDLSVCYWGATMASPSSVEGYFANADSSCQSTGYTLIVPSGSYTINGNVTFSGNYHLIVQNATFVRQGGGTPALNVTFGTNTAFLESESVLVTQNLNLTINTKIDVYPYWWYATSDQDRFTFLFGK